MLKTMCNEVRCKNFILISKLRVFATCILCHKRLKDASANSLKCHNCGTRQRGKDVTREASVRVCIEDKKGTKTWLAAFTKHIVKLLAPFKVTLQKQLGQHWKSFYECWICGFNIQCPNWHHHRYCFLQTTITWVNHVLMQLIYSQLPSNNWGCNSSLNTFSFFMFCFALLQKFWYD